MIGPQRCFGAGAEEAEKKLAAASPEKIAKQLHRHADNLRKTADD